LIFFDGSHITCDFTSQIRIHLNKQLLQSCVRYRPHNEFCLFYSSWLPSVDWKLNHLSSARIPEDINAAIAAYFVFAINPLIVTHTHWQWVSDTGPSADQKWWDTKLIKEPPPPGGSSFWVVSKRFIEIDRKKHPLKGGFSRLQVKLTWNKVLFVTLSLFRYDRHLWMGFRSNSNSPSGGNSPPGGFFFWVVSKWFIEIDRKKPPSRRGFLFIVFPNQEPEEEDPPRRICTRHLEGPLPPGSWLGNIVNRKPPRDGGVL